jgi:hypothetical protein
MESKFPTQDLRDVSSSNTLSIEQQLNELRTERERLQREQAVREQEGRLQLELQRQEELNELRRQVAELTQRARQLHHPSQIMLIQLTRLLRSAPTPSMRRGRSAGASGTQSLSRERP